MVTQLVKKYLTFYETLSFITRLRNNLLLVHTNLLHTHIFCLSVLILSSHLRASLPNRAFFPSGFLIKILYAFVILQFVLHGFLISSS
jgi:hypothetical protein